MKVLVLGAGVIGVTRRLRARRRRPRGRPCVDRQPAPALETSFANAGEVSPGYSAPWAGPGRAAEGDQVAADAPPAAGHPADTSTCAMSRWGLAMLRNCTAARYAHQQERAWCRLAEYSRDCLRALRADDRHRLRRAHAGHAAAVSHPEAARRQRRATSPCCSSSGVAFELLDRAGCIRHEPALARVQRQVRRRPAPARRRDRRLLQVHAGLADAGRGSAASTFRFGTTIRGARPRRRPHRRRRTPTPARSTPTPTWSRSAAIRRCCSRRSASASRSIRSRATRSPCRSSTPRGAPESTVMDETHKVAVTRLGDRIRVGGTAELAGYTLKLHEARREDAGARRRPTSSRAAATSRGPSSGAACGR